MIEDLELIEELENRLDLDDALRRIRVGDYRIIDAVEQDILLGLVVKVGHRRDVYR